MMLIDADDWLMLIDSDRCWLILIDYDWCWLVLIDAIGCWLILKDVREWHKLERTHIPWLSIFKCKSISSTYPGESVGRDGEGGLWSIPCFMHLLKLCKFLLWRSVWGELGMTDSPCWGNWFLTSGYNSHCLMLRYNCATRAFFLAPPHRKSREQNVELKSVCKIL